jgi:hypothetical protein
VLLGAAALAVVVSGCGAASKACPPTAASSAAHTTNAVTMSVPGNPSAHVNPGIPRYVPSPQLPSLEAACSQAADIAGADEVCQAKLKALLPLLTQLCPQHSHHMCLVVGFIAGQAGAVVKIINSLGGDATCAKNEIAMCVGVIVPQETVDKVLPSPPPSVTPSTTATPTPAPSLPGTPAPSPAVTSPVPTDSAGGAPPGGTPADTADPDAASTS